MDYSEKHGHPIFTLPVLTGRTYIVASPELCSAVQKDRSNMSLDPVISEITPRMLALNPHTAAILKDSSGGEVGMPIYTASHTILTSQNFANGAKVQLDYLGQSVNDVKNGFETDLFRFISHRISAATNLSFFGPKNPFHKNPDLLESFWDWESGIVALSMNVFPSITARKAYKGLMACARGFEEYIKAGGYEDAIDFLQERDRLHAKYGISDLLERGKLDVSLGLGINVNASITTFWLLNNVFSRPELLSQLRDEIRANGLVEPGALSAERLKQECPLLNAAYRETLRLYAPMSNVRYVSADTIIADTYLLRKGTVVQMAGQALHYDKARWGPDVESFNPKRFLHSTAGSKADANGSALEGKAHAIHPATSRSFGGGASLCPGRHFAQAEILSLSAALLLGFDMDPVDGTTWNPPPDRKRTPIAVMKPLKNLKVKMHVRKEFEGVKWELRL